MTQPCPAATAVLDQLLAEIRTILADYPPEATYAAMAGIMSLMCVDKAEVAVRDLAPSSPQYRLIIAWAEHVVRLEAALAEQEGA